MFGDYYSGDYVFRNLLNTPPFGVRNLGAFDPAIEEAKMNEINRMIDDLEAKSAQASRLVESAAPGITTDVSIWGLISWKGGETAQKYLNMRDAANAMYEKAYALINSYKSAATVWASDQLDIGEMRVYHQKFVDIVAEYDKFLGIVEEASEQRRESPGGQKPGFFDEIQKLLLIGLVGFAAIKFGPDIIKKLKGGSQ